MSSHKSLLNSSQDSEVMVRQVNLAAAIHDHISCTKISQQTIGTNICGLQTVSDISQSQTQTISQSSLPYETDHIYATENKNNTNTINETNSNINSNGIVGNNLFHNLSDERNQILKLTEMILAQLDLIQHQQEQLLKKDRQLQGLKQDREALCLRLEKMEKRIAVLTTKVANVNNTNSSLNLNRNIASSNNSGSNTTETECDQSGSDTIIDDSNSVIGLLTDPSVFAKIYSQSSTVTTSNLNINNLNNSSSNNNNNNSNNNNNDDDDNDNLNNSNSTTNATTANISTAVRIKNEPQSTVDCPQTTTSTANSTSVRKNRKRHPEVISTTTSSTTPSNKKRSKSLCAITNSDVNSNDVKKESLNFKETSCDSLSTLQSSRTCSNKKKTNKHKSESCRLDSTTSTTSFNCKTVSFTKDILTTVKPYSITINRNNSLLELSIVNNADTIDNNNTKLTNSTLNKTNCVEEKNSSLNSDNIEVPSWRLHPVSSCYSLEGTENLDDDVFNRRHSKLEIDERRRKRWDIQRLREQRHNEKLRTGRYYSGSLVNCFIEKPSDLKKKSCEFTSFFPDLKNLQSIEVTEKLPVIAFGHSIPRLPSKSFSLPWNISCEKPQTTAKARNSPLKKH